jgi:hypothetical protein
VIEYTLKNSKVHVIDNAMPQHVVDRWTDYYETQASFTLGSAESSQDPDTDYWFWMPVDFKLRTQLFQIQDWMMPHIQNYEPKCSIKDHCRSYVNLCTRGDKAKGHVDVESCEEGGFYVVALVFLNPTVSDPSDSGFEIEDKFIENQFNRLVIFDGRLWHRAQVPSDNLVRLTLYNSFTQPRRITKYKNIHAQWRK